MNRITFIVLLMCSNSVMAHDGNHHALSVLHHIDAGHVIVLLALLMATKRLLNWVIQRRAAGLGRFAVRNS